MTLQIEFPQSERQLTAILHHLPPERQTQLLAFARFLAFETFQTTDLDFLEAELDLDEPLTAEDARWDALLASSEGQLGLEKLAAEALAEIRAGKGTAVVITPQGELAPQ
jgi:hypothetical protein